MIINEIKNKFDSTWLTPSQKCIFESLTEKYLTQRVINIYGMSGTGKTFLAWNLENQLGAIRTTDISEIEDEQLVIVDDYSHKKNDIRSLMQEMFFRKIGKLIIITEKKADDDIISLCLEFTSEDKKVFKNNLWKHFNFEFNNEKSDYTMNSLIKYNMI